VHERFHTPVNAILVQSGWAIVLLLFWGTFEDVITYVAFTDWIFFGLAAVAVFVFRRSRKDSDRPYRTSGYPLTPAVFIMITIFFVMNTLIEKPLQAYAGLLFMSIGTGLFFYFKKKRT
jgi:APA family basic amino acid/polyamine antiporter